MKARVRVRVREKSGLRMKPLRSLDPQVVVCPRIGVRVSIRIVDRSM